MTATLHVSVLPEASATVSVTVSGLRPTSLHEKIDWLSVIVSMAQLSVDPASRALAERVSSPSAPR